MSEDFQDIKTVTSTSSSSSFDSILASPESIFKHNSQNMSAEELKRLRAARGQCKSAITRLEKFFAETPDPDAFDLGVRHDILLDQYNRFQDVQLQILCLDDGDDETEDIEERFITLCALIKRLKCNNTKNLEKHSASENNSDTNTQQKSAKLPAIQIPTYDGVDASGFRPFMDLFAAVIDQNNKMTPVEKLYYLRTLLKGEALTTIEGLPVSNESYPSALKLLNDRFDNPATLVNNHISVILDFPKMQRCSAPHLRDLASKVRQHTTALKNLNQPVQHWDAVLVYIILRKLDPLNVRLYHSERKDNNVPTLQEMLTFLDKRATVIEASQSTENKSAVKSQSKSVNLLSTPHTVSLSKCKLCEQSHRLFKCPQFSLLSINKRLDFVKENNICKICLGIHPQKCRYRFQCGVCKSAAHNTLLHVDKQENKPEVSLHSYKDLETKVLLPTIKVLVSDAYGNKIVARGLLDSGSQTSFCTSDLVERLGVQSFDLHKNIVTLGKNVNKIDKAVNIELHSMTQNFQINVTCSVVSQIATPLPQRKFESAKYSIPSNIALADNEFNIPGNVSILLGADIFFRTIEDGKIEGGPRDPVLLKTKFGYIISEIPTSSREPVTTQPAPYQMTNKELSDYSELLQTHELNLSEVSNTHADVEESNPSASEMEDIETNGRRFERNLLETNKIPVEPSGNPPIQDIPKSVSSQASHHRLIKRHYAQSLNDVPIRYREPVTIQPALYQTTNNEPSNDSELVQTHELNVSDEDSASFAHFVEAVSDHFKSSNHSVVSAACGPIDQLVYSTATIAVQGSNFDNTSEAAVSTYPHCYNESLGSNESEKQINASEAMSGEKKIPDPSRAFQSLTCQSCPVSHQTSAAEAKKTGSLTSYKNKNSKREEPQFSTGVMSKGFPDLRYSTNAVIAEETFEKDDHYAASMPALHGSKTFHIKVKSPTQSQNQTSPVISFVVPTTERAETYINSDDTSLHPDTTRDDSIDTKITNHEIQCSCTKIDCSCNTSMTKNDAMMLAMQMLNLSHLIGEKHKISSSVKSSEQEMEPPSRHRLVDPQCINTCTFSNVNGMEISNLEFPNGNEIKIESGPVSSNSLTAIVPNSGLKVDRSLNSPVASELKGSIGSKSDSTNASKTLKSLSENTNASEFLKPLPEKTNASETSKPLSEKTIATGILKPHSEKTNATIILNSLSEKTNATGILKSLSENTNASETLKPLSEKINASETSKPQSEKTNATIILNSLSEKTNATGILKSLSENTNASENLKPLSEKRNASETSKPRSEKTNATIILNSLSEKTNATGILKSLSENKNGSKTLKPLSDKTNASETSKSLSENTNAMGILNSLTENTNASGNLKSVSEKADASETSKPLSEKTNASGILKSLSVIKKASRTSKQPKLVNTVDQVTSDTTKTEVKELQVSPQFCHVGTDPGTDFEQKSVGALTSRHILPKSCCLQSGKKNSNCIDCVFVYDQPRCCVHRTHADASIQICPSLHHVDVQDVTCQPLYHAHKKQSIGSFGSAVTPPHCEQKPSDNLSDVLPPKVYKALYETGKLVSKVESKLAKSLSHRSSRKSYLMETDKDLTMYPNQSAGIINSNSGSKCFCNIVRKESIRQPSSCSKQSDSSESSQNPVEGCRQSHIKSNHDSFTQSETVHTCIASQNSPCDSCMDCEDTKKTQLIESCKYYSHLLTKRIGRVKDNLAKHLTPDQCLLNVMHEMPCIEACTMKPSGRGELACQTGQASAIPNALSCGLLTTSASLTDICRGNEDLNSVYYMLTAIETRIRRLRKNL